MLIPIYRHEALAPERYFYDTDQASEIGPGVVAFYGFQTQEPGTIPIYLKATTDPYRNRYDTKDNDDGPWNNVGVALYAYSTPQAGTVPIYEHQATGTPARFYYDMQIAGREGWNQGHVIFHAHPINPVRDLYVVAHQDDDLLFMSPNLLTSIASGNTVKTIYLTAGDANKDEDPNAENTFWKRREAGVKATYAKMAGGDDWELMTGKAIPEFKLKGRDTVSLVFFRLPSSSWENGGPSYHEESLKKLWNNEISTISPIDNNSVKYHREALIEALATLFLEFRPDRINTLDSTGRTTCSQQLEDPSNCRLTYPYGIEYFYDHTDHYHSALFALAAQERALSHLPREFWGCQFRRYRGYSVGLEGENIISRAFHEKQTLFFDVYGSNDETVGKTDPNYQAWSARQYFTDEI